VNRIAESMPDRNTISSLQWIKENSNRGDVVFSYYTNGLLIESIADRKTVLDSHVSYIQSAGEKFNDSNRTLYSRNLEETKATLDKYDVKYIWITPQMKQGEVWVREEQGLLFLFRNDETFKKVYSEDGYDVWKVLRS
jgi:uncharacterized membrane protein